MRNVSLDAAWDALDPPQRRRQTFEALKRLWLRETHAQPVLLVFEDLHWIDAETQEFLNGLMDGIPTTRLLLLVNYRPEYQHPWSSKTYYAQMRLDALNQENAQDLLDTLLGHDPALTSLKRMLIQRTEGNPFYLEESVRTLLESGALSGAAGAMRLSGRTDDVEVPATVQAILAARIDRLTPEDKRLLQTAAVIGKGVPFTILQAIDDQSEVKLRQGLMRLQAAEFIYETTLYPDLEYTFKHALTHEVAYNGLLQDRKRDLHGRIVQAIERLFASRLDEQAERLAQHTFQAEAWEKALKYLQVAARKASSRWAFVEAARYLEQALNVISRLPDNREKSIREIDISLALRPPLFAQGRYERLGEILKRTIELAQAFGDDVRKTTALSFYTQIATELTRLEEAEVCGKQAIALAEIQGDPLSIRVARQVLIGAFHTSGDYQHAAVIGRDAPDLVDEVIIAAIARGQFSVMLGFYPMCLAELGEFTAATSSGQSIVRWSEASGNPIAMNLACLNLGLVLLRQGRVDQAYPFFERALECARTFEVTVQLPWSMAIFGLAMCYSGRFTEGIALVEQGLDHGCRLKLRRYQSLRMTFLVHGHLLAGQFGQALDCAMRSFELAEEHREKGTAASAHYLKAESLLGMHPEHPDRAHLEFVGALKRARTLGMNPLVAHCYRGMGRSCLAGDGVDAARQILTTSLGMYREMNMAHWPDRAEADLAQLHQSSR